jgi:hypothetical protein
MAIDDEQSNLITPDEPLPKRGLLKFQSTLPYEIKTKEDLITTIELYFNTIVDQETAPTFTGLAMMLGITRTRLINLPTNNSFTPIIERAKQVITDWAEKQLFMPKSAAGVQFWLKNNDGWVDKQDISITKPKTMIDILQEIENKDPNGLPIIDQNPNQETNFFKHGEPTQPTDLPPTSGPGASHSSEPAPANGQDVEVEKPLSNYQ